MFTRQEATTSRNMKDYTKRNLSQFFSLAILFLGAAWIWLTRIPPEQINEQGKISAPKSGFAAPDFSLSDSSGNTITLSELQGKPVIINIWASWCTPCRAEMPALQKLHEDFKDKGLVILAVNSTIQDSMDSAVAFAEEYNLTFPILFDSTGSVTDLYDVRALPSTYFIYPDGIISEVIIGGPMSEALLRTRVENLFKGGN